MSSALGSTGWARVCQASRAIGRFATRLAVACTAHELQGHRVFVACVAMVNVTFAAEINLYDSGAGTLPSNQGWLFATNPFFGSQSTQSLVAEGTQVDSAAVMSEQAGYFSVDPVFGVLSHPAVPTLDRATGFSLEVELRIVSEEHVERDVNSDGKQDRAGFSMIALAEDNWGLELAFTEDILWAYEDQSTEPEDGFTQAESADHDANTGMVEIQLEVIGHGYRVLQDGVELLSGPVRNYEFFSGSPDVYAIPSFLFLGDDTSSASSVVELGGIRLNTPLLSSACDLNRDGGVDAADAGMLFGNWAQQGTGDVNLDGIVDAADAGVCFSDWTGDPQAIHAVPEPGTSLICSIVLVTAFLARRRDSIVGS